jgi:hypothetical protein
MTEVCREAAVCSADDGSGNGGRRVWRREEDEEEIGGADGWGRPWRL